MDAVILKYSVAKVSSEDDEYSTSELLSPGPSCKGWVTDKYCVYPQVRNFNKDYILKPGILQTLIFTIAIFQEFIFCIWSN